MKILIVEDEPVIARRIERFTREILEKRVTNIKTVGSLKEANSYLAVHPINLVFLDLNLKGKDGFDVLEGAQAGSFYTVIISAFGDRAIRAFDYPVVDFIEKPFGKDRLIQTFQKLKDLKGKNNFTSKFLSIKRKGEIRLVEVDDIAYIQGAGVYSELVMCNDKKELHHLNLKRINPLLPPRFIRIHKSFIANFYLAERMVAEGGTTYQLILKNGTQLPISRNRYPKLKKMLESGS